MVSARARRRGLAIAWCLVALAGLASACGTDEGAQVGPNDHLVTHAVLPSQVTASGLAYAREIARVHRDADADPARALTVLRAGLQITVPQEDGGELEILRLEVAARLCETLLQQRGGSQEAVDLLTPMLATQRSLPLHRTSARALVALGDAATVAGDEDLAVASYSRAIRMMSMLREELEP